MNFCANTISKMPLKIVLTFGAHYTYYNTERLHSAIYYLTPEDILLDRTEQRLKERQQKLDAARARRIKVNQEGEVVA